ncbi:MAG TPA: S8 family serine peptidase [Roseiarcus sp.]|nr:S8 family serine peptidase [Roseiarcus sp.]
MRLTSGRPEVVIGLIDGPIAVHHASLAEAAIRELPGKASGACSQGNSVACLHGTFMAGILVAKRGSSAPAICPGCSLLTYPIFADAPDNKEMPSATPEDLAAAILACIAAGAKILNLSLALTQSFAKGERALGEALDHAARKGVIVVAAAGNQGSVGGTIITRHPWVVPVAACDAQGRPTRESNLGHSMGLRGLSAPGEAITSLGVDGKPLTLGGTSVAAPFVTGAIALLWSQFPAASAAEVKAAVTQAIAGRRSTVTPPLLNAWAAYGLMNSNARRRSAS